MKTFHREIVSALPRLRRFAFALAGSAADADDLVQETVEKALRRRARYQEGTKITSWLFKIMQNSYIDQRRSLARRPRHIDLATAQDVLPDNASTQAEDRLFAQEVMNAITHLPENQRVVVALVLVDGCSYKEAASILAVPIGTIMSRLNRARKLLEQRLLTTGDL